MPNNPWYRASVLEAASGLARLAGREGARNIANFLARLSWRVTGPQLDLARANLRVVTGLQGEALERLVHENLRGFLRTMADYAWGLQADPVEIHAALASPAGAHHMDAAASAGKGILLVTGHLGNWELGALHMAERLPKLTVVTLEEPAAELTEWRAQYRKRLGVETIVIGRDPFAFVDIVKALQRGETVAMLIDRPYSEAAVQVPFCNRTAWFSNGPATLWRLTGALVLPVFMTETVDGRYRPTALPPVPFESHADGKKESQENTRRLAEAFEPMIRKHAAQWYQYTPIFEEALTKEA